MNLASEVIFRMAVGLIVALSLAIRAYFQRRVVGAEKIERRHERREKRFYRLVLASYLLIFMYCLTPWLDFAHVPLPDDLRWVGVRGGLASAELFWWTHRTLGANWSGVLEVYAEHALVTSGPYQRVRHPMYAAFFLSSLSILLMSANWLIGLANIGAITWMYVARVSSEETMMLDHVGARYREYMRQTGRLLPRLRV